MKSAVLIVIGVVLICIAVVMNNKASELESLDQKVNDSASNAIHTLTGNYERKKADKRDRALVYLLGGLGGGAILAGIVILGTGKKEGA